MYVREFPFISGIGVAPPKKPGAITMRGERGIPVPVPEAPPEKTVASQEELRERVEPPGEELGIGTDPGPVSVENEEPPPPFVPYERAPVVVHEVAPEYPPLAVRAGLEGKVLVKIWVDREGKARQVVVVRSDHEMFNVAALEAAKQFRFIPAYMNNGPVGVWVHIPFTFRLR